MISVIIGTFGDPAWEELAWSRAFPSVPADHETIVVHAETLAEARNRGAVQSMNPWLCFLDADDELTQGYLDAMSAAIRLAADEDPLQVEMGDRLFTPAIEYVGAGGRPESPMFHPQVPIEDGNWLVIGTVVNRRLFTHVGGFEEWPMYEDWALYARMQKAGATVVKVPDAIYRAHRNPRGRNHEGGTTRARATHDLIRRAVFPELYEEAKT